MNLNIFSGKAPKTARERAAEILDELQRIPTAIAQADQELQAACADELAARAAMADVEAGVALGERDAGDIDTARKAVMAAAERIASIESRKSALNARRIVRQDELVSLEGALNEQRGSEIDTLASQWYDEFDAALEAFKVVLWKEQVFKLATGRSLLLRVECTVKDMRRPLGNALSVDTELELVDVPGSDRRERVQVPMWRKNPAALQFHRELCEAGFAIDSEVKRLTARLRRERVEENAAGKAQKVATAK